MTEKISPFCPKYCVFINDSDEVFHRGCLHLEDVVINPPIEAESKTKPVKKMKIIGATPTNYYLRDEDNSLSIILKEGVNIVK